MLNTGNEKDQVFYLESLLNLYVKSIDPKALVVLEPVATGSEKELLQALDSLRRKDFVSEYLIMHVYSSGELPARAKRLMSHLGEYYSKSPLIEEHYLPAGFEPEPFSQQPSAILKISETATSAQDQKNEDSAPILTPPGIKLPEPEPDAVPETVQVASQESLKAVSLDAEKSLSAGSLSAKSFVTTAHPMRTVEPASAGAGAVVVCIALTVALGLFVMRMISRPRPL